ncbi:MAG: GNAT family N-acetyltransferase [Actinomycetota bacterium]|nr:GNAT family N-acetyltransferase [Actinomycetota bacterium]
MRRAEGWRRILESTVRDRQADFVVDIEGELEGIVSVGPCRDDDANGAGEVYGIYLSSNLWGYGIGIKLMAVALETLVSYGFDEARLWVFEANERARRFYEVGGWLADGGTKVELFDGFPITEVRYRREL